LSNVTPRDEGTYSLRATDTIGSATASATLTILVPPVFAVRPVPQSVVEGGNATFSALIYGYPFPFTNDWRRGSTLVQTILSTQNLAFFTLTNVQTNQAGSYNVVVRNRANPLGLLSGQAPLTVLADADRNGIPDAWETGYFGGPTDPNADPDGDTQNNRSEYIAGTDPTDPLSCLKVDEARPEALDLGVRLEFFAISNRTYTVQSSDTLLGGSWIKVFDVPATNADGPMVLRDTRPATTRRFYRLLTPRAP
jgi:hypothetical protein